LASKKKAPAQKTVKKTAKKAAKKSDKKPVEKAVKKTAKKTIGKSKTNTVNKAASKKAASKAGKKTATKASKKSVMTKTSSATKKTAAKKSSPKAAAKTSAKKAPAKKTAAKKAPATKTAAKKTPASAPKKKAATKKAPANKNAKEEDDAEDDGTQKRAVKGTIAQIVKKLVKEGKEKGYITYDQLNKAIPAEEFSSEQIEDAMSTLSDVGIQMTEADDSEDEEEEGENYNAGGNISSDDTGRTDDPVRMYLREMGTVELLSREGEIAIAKRIEAGREMMIGGICESPLAIESLIAWYDALQKGDILLREVIDLDATYSTGPVVDNSKPKPESEEEEDENDEDSKDDDSDDGEEEEKEEEENVSLAAMEEELKPKVFEVFAKIKRTYNKIKKVQAVRIEAIQNGDEPDKPTNTKYNKLKSEMVKLMDEVNFHNARIEQLVQALYKINRELVSQEGKLLRMAVDAKVKRESFLENYFGNELEPDWLDRVRKIDTKWEKFAELFRLRKNIQTAAFNSLI